ncbi:MAG: HDIG domain-containing protein [candidate division NC10 bacterium]|nr:HDIG domain-containing protein [candidate division NC10 bacterium]
MDPRANLGISPEEAREIFREYVRAENLAKHCLATEAIMQALANRLGEDETLWAMAGLLHDLDFEETKEDPSRHALKTAEILKEKGVNGLIIQAIKAHNAEALRMQRAQPIDFALTAAENITGLIVATALVYPDKKVSSVKASSVIKRMKEKSFARNVRREAIMECEKIGLDLNEFVEISLRAMQGISEVLGL